MLVIRTEIRIAFGGPVTSREGWLAGGSETRKPGGLSTVLTGKVTCGEGRCPAFLGEAR
ncbi:MAG: hypothetical protein RLZZ232_1740 [Planctomycetota bacterium]|jgi:hypothetical protein